jgi:hypothetical protein
LLLDPSLFRRTPDYLLKVRGDSMIDDGIFDGDLVGILQQADARDGQIVVARLDGEVTIKRLQRQGGITGCCHATRLCAHRCAARTGILHRRRVLRLAEA